MLESFRELSLQCRFLLCLFDRSLVPLQVTLPERAKQARTRCCTEVLYAAIHRQSGTPVLISFDVHGPLYCRLGTAMNHMFTVFRLRTGGEALPR